MDALPNEVLIKILWFFHPVYENLSGYALVSRKWDEILRCTASLWRHIHLEDSASARPGMRDEYEKVLLSCLKSFGNFIHCIRSEEEPYFNNPKLRAELSSLPNLRTLDVPVLSWTRLFAQALPSAPNLKSLTIDDYRSVLERASDRELARSMLHRRGLRAWDLNLISQQFPKLETLSLNICFYKLCNNGLLPILDSLHLKDLRLECVPFGMTDIQIKMSKEMSPIKPLVLSRHASILTLLELCNLPITMSELTLFLKNFNNLRHLSIGVRDTKARPDGSTLLLESQSLAIFVLHGMRSLQNERLKCVMPSLEVALVSECDSLEWFEVHATRLLQFSVKENCILKNILAVCQHIREVEVYDCPSLELQNVQEFLSRIPMLDRLDISQNWQTLELDQKCCKQIRKVILRDVTVSYTAINISCPTLSTFICTGDVDPNKGMSDRTRAGRKLSLSICADNLKKVQINHVYSANRIVIKCHTLEFAQIEGTFPWQTPVRFLFQAEQRIGAISLSSIPLRQVYFYTPEVTDAMFDQCTFGTDTGACRFWCQVVNAVRLVNCTDVRHFSLHALKVVKFSADGCTKLRELNLEHAKVGRVRITNCPLLKSRDDSFVHGLRNARNAFNA